MKFYEKMNLKKLGINSAKYTAFLLAKITAIAVCTGVYLGVLFFGDHGIEVYADLSAKCQSLKREISELNTANSRLQKEYFELKSIQGN